jgi:hypothetical protein
MSVMADGIGRWTMLAITLGVPWTAPAPVSAEVELLGETTPWRVWMVTGRRTERDASGLGVAVVEWKKRSPLSSQSLALTRLPPEQWREKSFDDHLWGRHGGDLADWCGLFGNTLDPRGLEEPKTLCLRTRFGIADPARAGDVRLDVEYVGGVLAFLNGKEIGRGHMPAGPLEIFTPADDYPKDAYTLEDPEWPVPIGPPGLDDANLRHFRKRVRRLSLKLPAEWLTKGTNVLALEVHHAIFNPAAPLVERRRTWWHLGVGDVSLTSHSGAGVVAYDEAARATRLWSAQQIEQVTQKPRRRRPMDRGAETIMPRSSITQGLVSGNPFDPVVPIRIQVPRNGIANGQVVLSDPAGLRNVSASIGNLAGPGGAKIPSAAVTVRYAAQGEDLHWCDELLSEPPTGATVMPVWLEVRAAKDQAPGWYEAPLEIKANGKRFEVSVQVFVSAFTVCDARDFRSLIFACHSPDAVALQYKVKPWSDEHFAAMEPSLGAMGRIGNDVMLVPVVLGSHLKHQTGLVRFVAKGDELVPDFTLLQRYIDAYLKHCARPKAVVFYVWTGAGETETADAYENRRIPSRTVNKRGALEVSLYDPATGTYTPRAVPVATDEGAERFYKPLLDGIHRIIVQERGWPEKTIMLGLGGDGRPSQRAGELFRTWAPYARWDLYSHFSGEPRPTKEGRMIATGGLEVGIKEAPTEPCPCCLTEELAWPNTREYLCFSILRGGPGTFGSPLAMRTAIFQTGRWTRLYVDGWPQQVRIGNLIWGATQLWLLGRREPAPVPTVRLQLIRESLQDFEAMLTLRLAQTRPDDPALVPFIRPGMHNLRALLEKQTGPGASSSYMDLMTEMYAHVRAGLGIYGSWCNLPQTEPGYDWPAWLARLHAAAAEAAGEKTTATWSDPPRGGRRLPSATVNSPRLPTFEATK